MDILVDGSKLFPYTFTPKGWAPCKGQLLQLLGTNFGGMDGRLLPCRTCRARSPRRISSTSLQSRALTRREIERRVTRLPRSG
jgi:microcystin-dependent protein